MENLIFILIGILLALGAIVMRRRYAEFYGQTPEDYEDGFPNFDLKTHLRGDMVCEGMIFGPMGRMTSTFTAEFHIAWDGDRGVMDELFHYNDGSSQKRQWIITIGQDGQFQTEAEDVPKGGKGTQAGPAVEMRYAIRMPESAGSHVLDAVDWMYLTPNGAIINRSQFRKFGFKVAELVATIRPRER